MEIGSIYEIDPHAAAAAEEMRGKTLRLKETEKYGKEHICLTASGREAIALALESLERNRPKIAKRCLLPAYMCDTVFFPFERAGWDIHFYHLNKELAADEESLRAQIEHIRPGLLFIHPYYGVDTWKPMRSLLHAWREQGICIMEDVTQAYYLEEAGQEADYVVGSLRKWYAVPDGGFVAANEALLKEPLQPNTEFTEKRMELLTQKWEYLHGAGSHEEKKALKADYLSKNRAMEEWLDAYAGIGALSLEAAAILAEVDEQEAKEKRNANYKYLCRHLVGKEQFVPILPIDGMQVVSDGSAADDRQWMADNATAPLYFAIYAKDRADLQKFLTQRDVYAPVLWPIGRENEDCLNEEERYIYEHMLALPMDQRYGLEEMQHIVELLEEYEKEKAGCDTEPERIGIRVDANDIVAMGHIMRCITIAKQLRKRGSSVLFFTADEYPKELLEQAQMDYVCLHTDYSRMEEEIPLLREELHKHGCRKLLVDSYQATEKYFEGLGDICQIVYMDDCFEGVYPVDMLINYNAYHVRFPYPQTYAQTKKRTKLLLGTAYVPLREEFQKEDEQKNLALEARCRKVPKAEIEKLQVLLSSGGGDVYNALTGILQEAVKEDAMRGVIFHVVVGRFNRNAEELEQLAKQYANIRLHYNVSNMAELMAQCTAAVSAAGTVLFELSAMQIPTVFFVCADNQQYDSEFFAKEERMLFAGDIRAERQNCLAEIERGLKRLLQEPELREKMKKALHKVTDGNGADRIAAEIVSL